MSMLVEHDLPEELRNNEPLRKELKAVAIKKAGENSPLQPDEAKRAFELITSGEIFKDLFYSFNVIFSLTVKPKRFSILEDNFKAYVTALVRLPESVIADLDPGTAFANLTDQIEQLKAGENPDDPEILNNTLKTIYSTPEVANTIDIFSALLAPENESLRIALLVYARLNGINLQAEDIDKVRATILVKENPNLGSLFAYLLRPENATRLAGA